MAIKQLVVFDDATGGLRNATASDTINIQTSKANVGSFEAASALTKGQAVYINTTGKVALAKADAAATTSVVGLVADAAISSGAVGSVVTDGPLEATTEIWDALTGETGGLTPGANYFLSDADAGSIVKVGPTQAGKYSVYVGQAFSATTLQIAAERPFGL